MLTELLFFTRDLDEEMSFKVGYSCDSSRFAVTKDSLLLASSVSSTMQSKTSVYFVSFLMVPSAEMNRRLHLSINTVGRHGIPSTISVL